ncbi:MAG: hypothetical protein JWP04_1473, partial [Belnapia sp.]|nr:hypothetical protein [Belnapia sp.]
SVAAAALPRSVAAAALPRSGAALPGPAPVDLPALRAQMREVAETVRTIFERRVGALGQFGGLA